MRRLLTILVAYIFLTYSVLIYDHQDIQFDSHLTNQFPSDYAPEVFVKDTKKHPTNLFNLNKQQKSIAKKANAITLTVFKGREAKLNRAIFKTLALYGPQTISELQKRLSKQKDLEGTYYASLTKRIRCLQNAGYINQVSVRTSGLGFRAAIYDICTKALLATFLIRNSAEDLFGKVTEKEALIMLSDLISSNMKGKKERQIKYE